MKKNNFLEEYVLDDCIEEAKKELDKLLFEAYKMGKNDCTKEMFIKHMKIDREMKK